MPEQWESFTEFCDYLAFEGEICDISMSQFDTVMSHAIITLVDGVRPKPLYQIARSVRTQIFIKGHIFAIEENPGFHERCTSEADK